MKRNWPKLVLVLGVLMLSAHHRAFAQAAASSASMSETSESSEGGDGSGLHCLLCIYQADGDWHYFAPLSCSENGEPCRACGGTSQCHADAQPSHCHVACSWTSPVGAVSRVVNNVRVAAASPDPGRAAKLIAKQLAEHSYLRLVADRGVVQIIGCKNTIIGQVKVAKTIVAYLERSSTTSVVAAE